MEAATERGCACAAGEAEREFDRVWPGWAPFPPKYPWLGSVGSRAGLRAEYVSTRRRHSRAELDRIIAEGEWQANSPLVYLFVTAVAAGVVLVWLVYVSEEVEAERAKKDGEDTGESDDNEDSEDSGDTGDSADEGNSSGGFWDGPDSGGCPPYTLC